MELPSPYAFNYHFDNGIFQGRVFAYFVKNSDTRQVIDAMHNLNLDGKSLRVEYKKYVPRPGEKEASTQHCDERNVNYLMSAITRYMGTAD
ncbi:hypothetical protein OCU04_007331 [Sclerotinia nivalis]|uniref:RRM domain-containing protein n=1 Tax=Sclerotinia nivalis TaxID=352851 RepID=A0A9X0AIJ7_9HELO|nr:hypothetical protein OCU04_007331 [Sclerotinia nivalis]